MIQVLNFWSLTLSGIFLLPPPVVTQLVPQYGWYILLGLILLMVAWTQLRHHVYAWLQRRNEQVEERNFGRLSCPSGHQLEP